MLRSLNCPECRDERDFEQPPCQDGHDDCQDWACVECGCALVIGVPAELVRPAPLRLPYAPPKAA